MSNTINRIGLGIESMVALATQTFLGTTRVLKHSFDGARASKVVDSIEYDTLLAELTVHLKSGIDYVYLGVPEEVYTDFIQAPSAGQYFSKTVGKGGYSFRKIVTVHPNK